uniref:Cuticle protein 76 n=1 Tax=Locusta migratoria TaxID=7004 RepID=CU76_LOCMI|nr:RecName: Full=Cuticle protein 76; AltName: Full=LM-ACP 76; Short=LM-76 [Locusta migratoria]AAB26590.1 Lm-76=14 kda cuticle structural protein [Locusta migratoria=migratory locusts, cuticle, Peptide, 139 aa] [Locusta migratoria]
GYLGGYAAPALAYGAAAVAPAAITSQQSNILRSYGNLGQVSTYSKTVDTPYSSVSKADIRVTNNAVYAAPAAYAAAPVAYAAPALGYARTALAAPALGYARAAYAAPAVAAGGLLGVAYSAAPAVAHLTYSGLHAAYAY